jgi:hypothetical protein
MFSVIWPDKKCRHPGRNDWDQILYGGKLFLPCSLEFSAEIFSPPQFSDIVPEKKLRTAEEAI